MSPESPDRPASDPFVIPSVESGELFTDEMRAEYERVLAEMSEAKGEEGTMPRDDGDVFIGEKQPGSDIKVGSPEDDRRQRIRDSIDLELFIGKKNYWHVANDH